MKQDTDFLEQAIQLAYANIEQGGRPFGALIVKDDKVIAKAVNQIMETNDPTAHAELQAIRAASKQLESPSLAGCSVFASGHDLSRLFQSKLTWDNGSSGARGKCRSWQQCSPLCSRLY